MTGSGTRLLVLDVNETLSDMTPLRNRFEDIGLPGHEMPAWFAAVLRDGFALTAAGAYADFADIARDALHSRLDALGGPSDTSAAVGHVLDGFAQLKVHPDVPEGVRALRAAGFRLVTMTNGAASLTERLLSRAGILDAFEALLDVGGPRRWKPAPEAYHYAAARAGVAPSEAALVAVHPWDIDGARRAGLAGAWLSRGAAAYPRVMTDPTWSAVDLRELGGLLTP